MITRAVGDRFGSGGIADRYIRLNGYPFLDKEDHVFDVPGTYFLLDLYRVSHETNLSS